MENSHMPTDSAEPRSKAPLRKLLGELRNEKSLLLALGRSGDPDLMEEAINAGVFSPAMQMPTVGFRTIKQFFDNAVDKTAALPVAQQALCAMAEDEQLAYALSSTGATRVMGTALILNLGADPNEPLVPKGDAGAGYVTALGSCFYAGETENVMTMLKHLAEQEILPIARGKQENRPGTLFDEMICPQADFNYSRFADLLNEMLVMQFPHRWQLEVGAAICRALEQYGEHFPEDSMDVVAAALASKAIMPPASWVKLMGINNADGKMFSTILSETRDWAEMKHLVENMIRDGVGPDDVLAWMPPVPVEGEDSEAWNPNGRGTLMQAAAANDNPFVVEPLLLSGANPRSKVLVDDEFASVEMDCFEIAERFKAVQVQGILNAWRAKDAIESVLANAKNGNSTRPA